MASIYSMLRLWWRSADDDTYEGDISKNLLHDIETDGEEILDTEIDVDDTGFTTSLALWGDEEYVLVVNLGTSYACNITCTTAAGADAYEDVIPAGGAVLCTNGGGNLSLQCASSASSTRVRVIVF